MSTKLTPAEVDAQLKREQIEKAKKELNKRLANKEKEVKK